MSSRGIVNPANAITLIRALALFPIWYCIHHDERQLAFVILVIAGLMDLADGKVARAFNCRSRFGEVFDSVADGFLYGNLLILLTAYSWAPLWPALAIISMGVFNMVGRVVYARRVGHAVNFQSGAMERFTGNIAFLIAFAINDYEPEFYFSACALIMLAIVVYDAKRMWLDPVPT